MHISYHYCGEYINFECTISDLKYATNSSGEWQTFTIDSDGNVGWYTSIALDSNDKVHISYYYDYYNKDLKYATNAPVGDDDDDTDDDIDDDIDDDTDDDVDDDTDDDMDDDTDDDSDGNDGGGCGWF